MDEKLFQSAKNYYTLALINILDPLSDDYRSYDSVFRQFEKKYLAAGNESAHSALFLTATRALLDCGFLDMVSSEFSPPYIRQISDFAATQSLPEVVDLQNKYKLLGSSGESWLRSTFQTIGTKFNADEAWEHVNKWLEEQNLDSPNVVKPQLESLDTANSENEEWEPLKIERSSEAYKEAIDSSEAAIREIEASNGYAASEPEERSAIVASAKGTLEAIKNGSPSKEAIRHGLLSPMKFIAKKFAETTIGEIAKIAATKLIAWLIGLA